MLVLVHLIIFGLAFDGAFRLRFDFSVPAGERAVFWSSMWWLMLIKLLIFWRSGSLHGWWRYVTFADLAMLLRAAVLSAAAIGLFDYVFVPSLQIPHSVLVLDVCLTILFVGGLRSLSRLVREHLWPAISTESLRPALMIGADCGGEAVAMQVHTNPRCKYRLVGFLGESGWQRGSRLAGIPFIGSRENAVNLARRHRVRDILVKEGSLTGEQLRSLVNRCRDADVRVKMIPPIEEFLKRAHTLQVREVNINDLLRREPVQLDAEAIGRMLGSATVLVTGAGGSIGAEICRQILRNQPDRLVLVDRTENNVYQIDRELKTMAGPTHLVPCIADVRDRERMQSILETYGPKIIFHAAAHKHVPLMEENPGEAIKNNVLGTFELVKSAHFCRVERFVFISTDKAVNPSSVMGVSKRLAERIVQAQATISPTKFVSVRFGNVLASAGSVVPLFQDQIRCGGPVTVTHPEMERFFMTIPEASQLVLQAAAMGTGGETFLLEMGEPVQILMLARDLIRLSGLTPGDDIEITFTGLRPGEKLSEELYAAQERTAPTAHPKIRVAYGQVDALTDIDNLVAALESIVDCSAEIIREKLQHKAPDYTPARRGASEEPAAALAVGAGNGA